VAWPPPRLPSSVFRLRSAVLLLAVAVAALAAGVTFLSYVFDPAKRATGAGSYQIRR
jgi:hypothetical protein